MKLRMESGGIVTVQEYDKVDLELLKQYPCYIWVYQPRSKHWRLVVDPHDPCRMHYAKQVETLIQDKKFLESIARGTT